MSQLQNCPPPQNRPFEAHLSSASSPALLSRPPSALDVPAWRHSKCASKSSIFWGRGVLQLAQMKWLAVIFGASLLMAEPTDFPDIVDFRQIPLFQDALLYTQPGSWTSHLAQSAYEMGYIGFNDAPEIGIFMNLLKDRYGLDAVVETGTFFGATALYFSLFFDRVYTIEASAKVYADAQKRFQGHSNIECLFGGSETVLPELLPGLKDKKLLFYLDAHIYHLEAEKGGFHYWPILEELEAISKTHKDNCIVVIDDFYVPNTNIHGCLDKNGQNEMSHELVREKLNKIFSGY